MNEPEIILCKYLTEMKASKDYIGCCGVMAGCIQKILEYLAEKETNSMQSSSSSHPPHASTDEPSQ